PNVPPPTTYGGYPPPPPIGQYPGATPPYGAAASNLPPPTTYIGYSPPPPPVGGGMSPYPAGGPSSTPTYGQPNPPVHPSRQMKTEVVTDDHPRPSIDGTAQVTIREGQIGAIQVIGLHRGMEAGGMALRRTKEAAEVEEEEANGIVIGIAIETTAAGGGGEGGKG
ncbi:hypothetical protein FRB90_006448, partial [Tulasnella sp. 427]